MNQALHSPAESASEPLCRAVTKVARALPVIALLAGLAAVGAWSARWSGSALLGVVAANFAFVLVAAVFPVSRPDRR